MSKAKGFKGKPARTEIPKFCASCHNNPDFMRKYASRQRVDQFELYQTSVHGKRLAAGDPNVATCIDCHSVHDIRAVKDAQAPVYPLNVAATCARCHADAQKMARYGIPTNQFAEYRTSVHWEALSKKNDLAAPTCASCHGNHGIHTPSTAMLAGPKAVCAGCHDQGTPPAQTAAQMAGWIDGLDAALRKSEALLASAEKSGMEVSEPQVKLLEGRDDLVKARLTMHSMHLAQMRTPIDAGTAIARQTLQAGEDALHERDFRRWGLAVSVLFIAIAILAIRLLLRRIDANGDNRRARSVQSGLSLKL